MITSAPIENDVTRLRQMAERLTKEGWRFLEDKGPRGFFYRGIGPRRVRIIGDQDSDKRKALAKAIVHAATMY